MKEGIRFRCPKCRKLYKYTYPDDGQSLYKSGHIPFQCHHCHSKFAVEQPFELTEEVPAVLIGESIASISSVKKEVGEFACPQCDYQNKNGSFECMKCGVIFQKWKEKALNPEMVNVEGSKALKVGWARVLADYGNIKVHEEFMQLAFKDKKLPFACSQYRRMLNIHSADNIAQKMMDRLTSLAMVNFIPYRLLSEDSVKRFSKVPMIFIGIAITLIGLGFLLPFETL